MSASEQRQKNIGRLQLLAAALLWGLAGVCVKSITWGPMPIVAVRSFVSLLMLFAVKRSFKLQINKTNLLGAILLSGTCILYVIAIKLTTAGTAIVLQYIAPILVFLYCVIFRHRKATFMEVILTFAVFAGCVLSFLDNLDFTHVLGNLLALGSGFTFAGQILVMNGENCNPQDTTILSNIICCLIALPFCFTETLSWTRENIFWLLIIAIFQFGLANICFSNGIKKVESVEASLLLCLEPIFNPIPVAIIYGEKMGLLAICGSILVIVSVTLYSVLPHLGKAKQS